MAAWFDVYLKIEQQEHAGHGRDERGREPARQHAMGASSGRPSALASGVQPDDDLREDVRHSMYPRPRSWSDTCASSSSSTLSRLISFSTQSAMNSSTLL